jgi:hypothetical protein
MQIVENEVVSSKTITIDEKHFVNCRYKNCTVLYGGGDFGWTNTYFENCQINLSGPAQKTANLLTFFGVLKPPSGTGGDLGGGPKKPDGNIQ